MAGADNRLHGGRIGGVSCAVVCVRWNRSGVLRAERLVLSGAIKGMVRCFEQMMNALLALSL